VNSKTFLNSKRLPSPVEDSDQTVYRDGSETRKNQEVDTLDHNTLIEQAETRTDQANTRTQQAEARTDQANTRTDEANSRTDEANTRTEQA